MPSGIVYEYYQSTVLKRVTYPNVGIREYLDENFYETGNEELTEEEIKEMYGISYNAAAFDMIANGNPLVYIESLNRANILLEVLRANGGDGCMVLENVTGLVVPVSGPLTEDIKRVLFGLM